MRDRSLDQLLGTGSRDPGCDGAFEVLDEYVEAVSRGDDVARRYAEFLTHLHNCAACREDTEGLLAAMRDLKELPPKT